MPVKTVTSEVDRHYATLANQLDHDARQVIMIKRVIELFVVAFEIPGRNYDRLRQIISGDYKQHNILVGDGPDSVIEFDKLMCKLSADLYGHPDSQPNVEFHFKRMFVHGDFVINQMHAVRYPGDRGLNVVDIFRFRGDLIVEHWDTMSEIPPESSLKHSNGVF